MLRISTDTTAAKRQEAALDRIVGQLADVIDTIDGTASQTNMLAHNAAIEG